MEVRMEVNIAKQSWLVKKVQAPEFPYLLALKLQQYGIPVSTGGVEAKILQIGGLNLVDAPVERSEGPPGATKLKSSALTKVEVVLKSAALTFWVVIVVICCVASSRVAACRPALLLALRCCPRP